MMQQKLAHHSCLLHLTSIAPACEWFFLTLVYAHFVLCILICWSLMYCCMFIFFSICWCADSIIGIGHLQLLRMLMIYCVVCVCILILCHTWPCMMPTKQKAWPKACLAQACHSKKAMCRRRLKASLAQACMASKGGNIGSKHAWLKHGNSHCSIHSAHSSTPWWENPLLCKVLQLSLALLQAVYMTWSH